MDVASPPSPRGPASTGRWFGIACMFLIASTVPAASPAEAPSSLAAQLRALGAKRVWFGHQSVGDNVLDGIRDLASEAGVPVRIVADAAWTASEEGAIVEARVGRNTSPLSKIQAFEEAMDAGWAGRSSVAFFKFCYVDFDSSTDVRAIFDRYVRMHDRLKDRHPEVTRIHVTVPLTVTQGGMKARFKHLLGRAAWGERENAQRHRFNELLRDRYAGKEPFFDLARLESEAAGSTPARFVSDGTTWPSLDPSFTDDGEHLNERGRRHVARALVELLASLP